MLQFIFDGGFLMWPITLLSVVGFAIIIDRACAYSAAKRDSDTMMKYVLEALNENRFDDAMERCVQVGGPVASVVLLGLQKFEKLRKTDRSTAEMSEIVKTSMEEYAPQIIGTLERNVSSLPIVASLSPLLGMTGTVTGMISSFESMANSTTLEATAVSAGISEALITTAAGLLVAMPSVIAYNIFTKLTEGYVTKIENACTALVDYIALDYEPGAAMDEND